MNPERHPGISAHIRHYMTEFLLAIYARSSQHGMRARGIGHVLATLPACTRVYWLTLRALRLAARLARLSTLVKRATAQLPTRSHSLPPRLRLASSACRRL